MATAIYRRLQVGVCRAAAITSFARWTSTKLPDGQSTAFQSAKTSADFKKANSNAVDLQESKDLHNPSAYSTEIVDNGKGIAEYGYRRHRSAEDNKSDTTRSQIWPKSKKIILASTKTSERRLVESFRKSRTENPYPMESFDSMADPRCFQQCRPEYKLLCYNAEHPIDTSMWECEDILQKVTPDGHLAASDISDFFEKLSYAPKMQIGVLKANKKFRILCSRSTANLPLYTNAEIIRLLDAFVRLKIPANHSMLKGYEVEFSRRVWDLSTDELLHVADTWRCISCSVPKFLGNMYNYMRLHCTDLNLAQVIQLIYIIGEGRRAPEELMERLESMVLRYLNTINVEEIGAVCLGYFKTGNGLSEYLMRKFGDIIIENIEEIGNFSLVNVLKMFRFTRVDHLDFFKQVGQVFPKRIPVMGTQGMMHVVLCFASMHILNEDLMDAVALALPDRVSYCRSKDIAKFLWSFGVLTYEPPNADVFYSALINEISKNLREFQLFPEHFLTCLMALAFCERFPLDLIKLVLSKKFIAQSTKISLFELKKDLFTISGSVQIECPEYKGVTVLPELREEVTEMLVNLSNKDIYVKPEFLKAASMLEFMLGGPEYVKNHMILPHTRSKDLEVHLDIYNKPIAINVDVAKDDKHQLKSIRVQVTDDFLSQLLNKNSKPALENSYDGSVDVADTPKKSNGIKITNDLLSKMNMGMKLDQKAACRDDTIRMAIQVTNRNHYCYGTERLLGLHNMKRRQLRKLGYVVVELPYWEWFPLTKRTQSEQLAYLHCKVFGSVEYDG
ncbi:FAST kinase domain-containing protein 5, mitochondrial [Mixophyes fleayi]|uniref:FAST kinase domain-containing protein 5, mitochondrial n=1 Tax=Mixophyes fleayi TaxID=3061075 RepID=UPI003F4D79FC